MSEMVSEIVINLKSKLKAMRITCLDCDTFVDASRGNLGVLDQIDLIPFTVSRIFFHYNIGAGSSRGQHAHKICRQLLIPLQGFCDIKLQNQYGATTFKFQEGQFGILIPAFTWVEMSGFSGDFVGLTLADQHYKPDDYIHNLCELESIWKHGI
jgi:hypothetical protein